MPKVAIVCDWLTNMGGAEHLVYSLHKAFPDAPIYTSVFDAEKCPKFKNLDIRTTYLQKFPRALRNKHQLFPVLRWRAFAKLDLSEFDIVISSASAEAKGIKVKPGAKHVCYCHTPTRYYWSHYEEYLKNPGFGWLNPLIRLILPVFVGWMRKLDLKAAASVDEFIANSHEVQARIKKYYNRDSKIIFPPVEVERVQPKGPVDKANFYLTVGRQIPYKRIDLAIKACNKLSKKLIVIGQGSEHQKLVDLAGPTIKFRTDVDDLEIVEYFQQAKAFIFPSLEDFGIVPVEAMAAGTPVIAYQQGGALDYVIEGKTGTFFEKQTTDSVANAIQNFEKLNLNSQEITKYANKFSEKRFIDKMVQFVNQK